MKNKEQNTEATPEYKAVSLAKNYLRDKSQDASIMSAQVSRLIHVIESMSQYKEQNTGMSLQECKDEVARLKGYKNWESYENWIIDNNSPVNVALCLMDSMQSASELYASQPIKPKMSLQECKDVIATKVLEYPATWADLSAFGRERHIDELCELYASQGIKSVGVNVSEIDKLILDFQQDLRESTSTYIKQNCEGAIYGLQKLKFLRRSSYKQ